MTDVNYDDFKNICRTCMINSGTKIIPNNVLLEIFNRLTDICFETSDDLPQQICLKCLQKLNEIHEFSLQCKQTHSSLIKCLNKIKTNQIKSEINEPVTMKEEITIEEHKIEFVEADQLQSKNDELMFKVELNEDRNCFEDNSLISNTMNINYKNESDIEKLNDLNKNINPENESRYNEDQNSCNKIFLNSNLFENHKSVHSDKRYFKCDQCSKLFSRPHDLKRHELQTHSGERPFQCDQCSKTFSHSKGLKDHKRTHSGDRPYKCNLCEMLFNHPYNLRMHMHVHTGERPFKCEQCSKSFIQLSNLKRHVRMHNGERPFECNQCSKAFTDSLYLKRHMCIHSDERPFKCEQCSKSFKKTYNLKIHMRMHSGEQT